MSAIIPRPKPTASRKPARRAVRAKKPFYFELTAEDIAFDQAVSAAAARGLAVRRT